MNLNRCIVILIMLSLVGFAHAQRNEAADEISAALSKLDLGIELLERNEPDARNAIHEAAADLNRAMHNHGIETPGAYHALGNAYTLAGDEGRAVLAYKRGERLNPVDPRLQDSLKRSRDRVEIEVQPDTGHRITQLLMSWRGFVSRTLLWGSGVAMFCIAWLAFTARVGFGAPGWFIKLGLWSLACSLIPFSALTTEWLLYQGADEVVIVQPGITARSGPDDSIYEPVFTEPLSAGVEAVLIEQRDGWGRLELASGNECWVPIEAFERVFDPTNLRDKKPDPASGLGHESG